MPNETDAAHRGAPGAVDATLLDGPAHGGRLPILAGEIKDAGAQMRVAMDTETVNEYAQAMLAGVEFPPVIVFFDGAVYWLGDGYHRVAAARKIKRETIEAEVRSGSAREAIFYGAGANAIHGLKRTQADRRQAIERLLDDPEWARLSDRQIADHVKVDHKTVGKVRRELAGEIPTGKAGGEIPTAVRSNGKPNGKPNKSLVDDLLRTIETEVLIAECHRRGLEVAR